MNTFKCAVFLAISLTPLLQAKASVSTDASKPLGSKYETLLQKVYAEIQHDYAPILEAHKKVKGATPAEYAFYVDALKDKVIEAVETNKLEYKTMATRAGYALFTNADDQIEFNRKPLYKCAVVIIPKTIQRLEFNKKRAKKSPLMQDVDQLISQLNDIKRIINR